MEDEVHSVGPVKVVVASSSKELRSILSWSLVQDGRFLVVAELARGDEVVAFAKDFDVAVIDLVIQGLGAFDVVRNLSARTSRRPAAIVTGVDAVYLRHAIAAEGASDYLVLPDDLEVLAERVFESVSAPAPPTSVG